jgi:hypothetical protein
MKHAGAETLRLIDDLLVEIRKRPELRERTPGSFYLKSKGYLHFHEDPTGIFADVKLDLADFTRLRATTAAEQRALLKQIDRSLAAVSARAKRA